MRFTTAALVALPLLGSGFAAPVAAPEHQEDKRLLGFLGGLLGGGGQPALPSIALPSALPTGGLLPGLLGPSGIIDGTVSLCPVLGANGVVVNLNGKPLLQPCPAGSKPTPSVSLPSISLPSVSLPAVSLPAVSLPAVSLPAVSLPAISLPVVSISVGLGAGVGGLPSGALPSALPTGAVGSIIPEVVSKVSSVAGSLPSAIAPVVSAVGGAVGGIGAGLGLNLPPVASASATVKVLGI